MQGDQDDLKTSTVPQKYVKNHAGAKILAAGYTKGTMANIDNFLFMLTGVRMTNSNEVIHIVNIFLPNF
jgi:hypothetical protein